MLQIAYFLAKIGVDTAENLRKFCRKFANLKFSKISGKFAKFWQNPTMYFEKM